MVVLVVVLVVEVVVGVDGGGDCGVVGGSLILACWEVPHKSGEKVKSYLFSFGKLIFEKMQS